MCLPALSNSTTASSLTDKVRTDAHERERARDAVDLMTIFSYDMPGRDFTIAICKMRSDIEWMPKQDADLSCRPTLPHNNIFSFRLPVTTRRIRDMWDAAEVKCQYLGLAEMCGREGEEGPVFR